MDTAITKKQKTQQEFGDIRNSMLSEGYSEKSYVIPKATATLIGIVIGVVLTFLDILLFRAIYGVQTNFVFSTVDILIIAIPSIILHELLHGVGWVFGCKNGWESIDISFASLMPLCHCKEPLKRSRYMLGVLLPFLVLSVGVSAVAFILGNLTILCAAAINLIVTGGDIMIVFALLRDKEGKIVDHPTEAGYVIFSKSYGLYDTYRRF